MRKILLPALFVAVVAMGCATETASAKSKCDGCGKEVEASTLASHDGAMLCEACIAAHDH